MVKFMIIISNSAAVSCNYDSKTDSFSAALF